MIIGSKIEKYAILSSTNTFLTDILKKERPGEGLVVHTGFQTGGRGQAGNRWESERDKNLLFSVILYPEMIAVQDQFYLSVFFSLGLADFLSSETGNIRIKWPNDIYVNDDKIAGILIENAVIGSNIDHTVAGAGININQTIFVSDAPNPTSLALLTGKTFDPDTVFESLLKCLDIRYKQLILGEKDKLWSDYLGSLYRKGERQLFKDKEGLFIGIIDGINRSGQLMIRRGTGELNAYSFREVEFIRQSPPSR